MGRPPLPVGTFGPIHFRVLGRNRVQAGASFRDPDGRRRYVVRTGPTRAQAERRLREVTVPAIDRLLASVHAGNGPGAAKSTRSVLSGILGPAVRHGLPTTNPVRDTPARARSAPPAAPRALTVAEAGLLQDRLTADPAAVRQDLPDLVAFLLGTGLRIGEACALRAAALDLTATTLTVTGTVIREPGRGLLVQEVPKFDAGRRTIALPPFVVDLFRRCCAAVPPDADPAVLFPSPQGRLRDPSNTSGDLRRAGFDWVTSHVFRKTVATRLDEAGLSARQIADHLGHTRPSLTQDVYMGRRLASPDAAAALQRTL